MQKRNFLGTQCGFLFNTYFLKQCLRFGQNLFLHPLGIVHLSSAVPLLTLTASSVTDATCFSFICADDLSFPFFILLVLWLSSNYPLILLLWYIILWLCKLFPGADWQPFCFSFTSSIFMSVFLYCSQGDYNMSIHGLQKILDIAFLLNRHFLPEALGPSSCNISLE